MTVTFVLCTIQVEALNGSGRAPGALTLDRIREDCFGGDSGGAEAMPKFHAHTVTVPGAAAGWAGACRGHGAGGTSTRGREGVLVFTTPHHTTPHHPQLSVLVLFR